MSIQVTWDNEKHTVMLLTFRDPWDWEDYQRTMDQAWQMLDTVQDKVVTIVDFSNSLALPKGAVQYFSRTAERIHPNQGSIIICNASPFLMAIGKLVERLYPQQARRVRIADDVAHARQMLARSRWGWSGVLLRIVPLWLLWLD
jgi:hypothetical protein